MNTQKAIQSITEHISTYSTLARAKQLLLIVQKPMPDLACHSVCTEKGITYEELRQAVEQAVSILEAKAS